MIKFVKNLRKELSFHFKHGTHEGCFRAREGMKKMMNINAYIHRHIVKFILVLHNPYLLKEPIRLNAALHMACITFLIS